MGAIRVHEFMSLDGVIDAPTWTFDYGFDPKMGEAIAASMAGCEGILLDRATYEMFEPAWSQRTVEDDPGAPFFNDTTKYVVSSTLTTTTWNSQLLGPYDPDTILQLKATSMATCTSAAAARSCTPTASSTNCTSSSTHLPAQAGRASSPKTPPPRKPSLAASACYDNGVVHLNYRPEA
jgi:dihydrofolate reductase